MDLVKAVIWWGMFTLCLAVPAYFNHVMAVPFVGAILVLLALYCLAARRAAAGDTVARSIRL